MNTSIYKMQMHRISNNENTMNRQIYPKRGFTYYVNKRGGGVCQKLTDVDSKTRGGGGGGG